jgi:hypothetical protein
MAVAVTLAILGTSATTLPWLALIAIGGMWMSRRAESTLGVLAAMSCAALLAAPWWLPAIDLQPETVRSDVTPRFYFAPTLSGHVPSKIRAMSHDALPRVGAGGTVVLRRVAPDFAMDVDSRGWNLLGSTVPWWNGWRVYWNGERLPPVRIGNLYVGTFVPPGVGTIRVRYRPDQFDQGLRLAVAGVLLLIVTLLWPWHVFAAPHTQAFMRALGEGVRAIPLPRPRAPSLAPLSRGIAAVGRLGSRFAPSIVVALFIVYGAVLITHRVDTAGGADSSGYLNQARLWREGRLIVSTPQPFENAWAPLGFVHGPRPQTMVPSYPPGVPLQMAALRLMAGERAPFFLSPLAAMAAILLLYRLARDLGFSPGWSAAAAALLALCPVFLFHAIQAMSDVVAACWALAAMVCAFRGGRDVRFALLAGVCLGVGVLVRPTQILLLPAIVAAMGLNRRALAALIAGGAPFALVQMAFSSELYGNPFATGYGSVLFDLRWSYFPARFLHYSFWLAAMLSPFVFPLGLAGFGKRDVSPRVRIVLALWFVPFFLFYCFYGPYDTWWYTRFLLPAIPAVILASLYLLRRIPRLPAAVILACIFALQLGVARRFDVIDFAVGERGYRDAARLVPRDGTVLSMQHSGSLYYYTGRPSLRYDYLRPGQLAEVHGPVYALAGEWELDNLRAYTGVEWVPVARVRDVMLLKPKL